MSDDTSNPMSRDELLARVVRSGTAMQRRNRWKIAIAAVAATTLVGTGLALANGNAPHRVYLLTPTSGPTTPGLPSTTRSTTVESSSTTDSTRPPVSSSSQTSPVVTTTSSTPDPATSKCYQSVDPACGPVMWDPPVADHAPQWTVTFDPARPVVGDTVKVTVTLDDLDTIDGNTPCFSNSDSPGTNFSIGEPIDCAIPNVTACQAYPTRHGTWPAPTPKRRHGTISTTQLMTASGPLTWHFDYAACSPTVIPNPYETCSQSVCTITTGGKIDPHISGSIGGVLDVLPAPPTTETTG